MTWIAFWIVITLAGASTSVALINSWWLRRAIATEIRAQRARSEHPTAIESARLAGLPPPVRRYLMKALGGRSRSIRSVDLRHGGAFRPHLDGRWFPILGEQHFTGTPPSFVWWGRVRMGPGMWIDACDRLSDGSGKMLVKLESTLTIADAKGPQLDQGALLRLLGELVWLPTAFLDERYVQWRAVDESHADAILSVDNKKVSGRFEFGADLFPSSFAADRYRDLGGGKSALTPFIGRMRDYRSEEGILVPHAMVGAWRVNGKDIDYAKFDVLDMQFDSP